MEYLKVAGSLGDRSCSQRMPGTLEEEILECFNRNTVLTSEQLNARVSSNLGSFSSTWFSKSIRKLVASGKLQRQGERNSYKYQKVLVKEVG